MNMKGVPKCGNVGTKNFKSYERQNGGPKKSWVQSTLEKPLHKRLKSSQVVSRGRNGDKTHVSNNLEMVSLNIYPLIQREHPRNS